MGLLRAFLAFSQKSQGIPAPAQGGHGTPSPSLWAAGHPPLHPLPAAVQSSPGWECRRRSLPRGVCPGQTNPRNLGPVYKKPRGCSVPRSIWECLGLEQGLSRCRVITWVLLRPHQSRQPLISGSSWHDKGTVLSPALCTAPGLGFGWGWIQPHSEAGLVGCKGGLSSKKGSFGPKMSHLQPRQREQGAVWVHPNSPRDLAGTGWGCLCCCNEFAGLSSPLGWGGDTPFASPCPHDAQDRLCFLPSSVLWVPVARGCCGNDGVSCLPGTRPEPKIAICVFPLAPPLPLSTRRHPSCVKRLMI